jgi:cyclase
MAAAALTAAVARSPAGVDRDIPCPGQRLHADRRRRERRRADGEEGVLVVDTGAPAMRDACSRRSAVVGRTDPLDHQHARGLDHTGGNETISQAGMTVNGNPAAIVAHENVLARMSDADRPVSELPLNTFFEAGRDFYFNGEAIFLYTCRARTRDGDIVVYFRGSDVLVAGELFVTTRYPVIDLDGRVRVDGFFEGLNAMLDIAVPAYLQEGGTYVFPGSRACRRRGRPRLEYRDMIFIVRDRVATRGEGMTLEQVLAAKPALDYDTALRQRQRRSWTSAISSRPSIGILQGRLTTMI